MKHYVKMHKFPTRLRTMISYGRTQAKPVDLERGSLNSEVEAFLLPHNNYLYGALRTQFKQPVLNIIYMTSPAKMGRSRIHTDKSRHVAVNFEVDVDHNLSKVLVGNKPFDEYRLVESHNRSGDVSHRFEYDANQLDEITLHDPIVLDVSHPHGWTNNSKRSRTICTVTLANNPTFDEVVQRFKELGYVT